MQENSNSSNDEHYTSLDYAEHWYQRAWRPSMAFIYMILCVLDYGVRPMVNYFQAKEYDLPEIIMTIQDLDPAVQVQVLTQSKQNVIDPILTEFVHLSFGAILGVAAFSRGAGKGFAEGSPTPPSRRPDQPQTPTGSRGRRPQKIDNPDDEPADG